MSVTIDPAVQLLMRTALSLLFASAALHKLRDFSGFVASVEAYRLLPGSFVIAVCAGLISVESTIALLAWRSSYVDLAAAFVLAVYAMAITINLARGRREIDCGCNSFGEIQLLSWWLTARNGILALLASISALPAAIRPWSSIDALTVAAGVLVLSILYVAADVLAAWQPRLMALRTEIQHG